MTAKGIGAQKQRCRETRAKRRDLVDETLKDARDWIFNVEEQLECVTERIEDLNLGLENKCNSSKSRVNNTGPPQRQSHQLTIKDLGLYIVCSLHKKGPVLECRDVALFS